MTTARKKAASKTTDAEKVTSANLLQIKQEQGKSKERQFAEIGLSPATLNTMTARIFSQGGVGEIDITEAVGVMRDKVGKVNAGDTSELEATLTAQSVSLDALFNELARRAASNMGGGYMQAMEIYMRLALKAQAQCARTIEVLATIKNPPVVFAKQANISNGPQQVNNGMPTHTGKTSNQSNELSGASHELLPDTRTQTIAGGINQTMETMGAINGATNG